MLVTVDDDQRVTVDDAVARVVRSYTHLGTIFTATGSTTEEATARVRMTMAAYRELAGLVCGSPKVSLRTKLRLADTLLWSILLFATGIWSTCTPTVLRCFNTAYMRVLRKRADAWGMPTLLRRERLRCAARAARAGTPQLSALFQNAGGKTTPWMALITVDMHALRAREGFRLSDLPEFSADPRLRTLRALATSLRTDLGNGDGRVHSTALHVVRDGLCVRGCAAHAHVQGAWQPGTGRAFRC